MTYGSIPKHLGVYKLNIQEIMTYQYMPIKLPDVFEPKFESRLNPFKMLIGVACCDYIAHRGLTNFVKSYVYLTAKHRFVTKSCPMNRPGYHSDGFMTDDINYIWSDYFPTVFNSSEFRLSTDDVVSMNQMEKQAQPENDFTYANYSLVRLNQFNIHKTAEVTESRMRTFFKLSFSKDKYNLVGNTHNYELDYDWEMKERTAHRNITSK